MTCSLQNTHEHLVSYLNLTICCRGLTCRFAGDCSVRWLPLRRGLHRCPRRHSIIYMWNITVLLRWRYLVRPRRHCRHHFAVDGGVASCERAPRIATHIVLPSPETSSFFCCSLIILLFRINAFQDTTKLDSGLWTAAWTIPPSLTY